MANTGIKQASIAYKVSKPGGEPLDVNGQLTRLSGRKQAIALLEGFSNPNPAIYEVEFYYNRSGVILGNPTTTFDVVSCPVGYFRVTPTRLILDSTNLSGTLTLESSNSWRLISGPTDSINIDYTAGAAGIYTITVSRKENTTGQGYFIFRNEATLQTVSVFVASVIDNPWILEDGTWNMLGFWYDDGIWNY